MDAIGRAAAIYFLLYGVFRIAGKRTLAQITTFDLVLVLIVGEATQQALLGADDPSFTNAALVIVSLVGLDIVTSFVKQAHPRVERWLDGVPLVLIDRGRLLEERMAKVRIDVDDIAAAGRAAHGLERLDQIQYAVLERDGAISVIPWPSSAAERPRNNLQA